VEQIKIHANKKIPTKPKFSGNAERVISTGSTLLDLAISGGRIRGGGLPSGILVEIFGPSGSGKTVLLCEIAGAVQRQNGEIKFYDPEARLNKQFAKLFGLKTNKNNYDIPDTITEVFGAVRKWKPEIKKVINRVFADSLTALSTEMEMEDKDKMGMRRAKEFSEELRKTCRSLIENNLIMVCSNQVRQNMDVGPYGQKYKSPGGEAIGFYSSLRLRCIGSKKIKIEKKISGKELSRVTGISVDIEIFKSSVWKPYRIAPLTIIYDYGIDDIRENLRFVKQIRKSNIYLVGRKELSNSLDVSIAKVEELNLEEQLREETIDLWEKIESEFDQNRKPKR